MKSQELYDKLMELLDENKATYRLIDHEVAAAAKCILIMVKKGKKEKHYVLGVVPGDAKMDLNAVKALYDGTYASFADRAIAEELSGCSAESIPPFSFNPELELIVDPRLLEHDEIFFKAVDPNQIIALKTSDYVTIAKPRQEEIALYEGQKQAASEATHEERVDELSAMRHSAAHVLAQAVLELFPEAKLGVGPVIDDGFYYDFELPRTLIPEDLDILQEKMERIVSEDQKFVRQESEGKKVLEFLKAAKQDFKVELAEEFLAEGKELTLYENVDKEGHMKFVDLCRGGHTKSTKGLGAFKLHKIAAAYWRGDQARPQLQRIYGWLFPNQKELEAHIEMLKEAAKRDHRKLGQELEIFMLSEEVGAGLPLWLPNGAVLVEEIEKLAKQVEFDNSYARVRTPHITKGGLYHKSGHLPYYADSMFPPMKLDNEEYYLKPMNCPHHHLIYGSRKRSYRELPLRLAEYGHCYRFEDSGSLFGLMRVRSMCMNDAHIYCTPDQFESEFLAVLEIYKKYFDIFGIEKYIMRLSLHDKEGLGKKYVNEPELWLEMEEKVRRVMQKSGVNFVEVPGEAAFYGPKIDVEIFSAIGREFTLATNQLDFAVPKRFDLTYVDSDGKEKTPLCVHRAPLSTHERLIGFLIEHFAGAFPTWLAPVQVSVLPISDKFLDYANEVADALRAKNLRVSIDDTAESLGKKIHNAEAKKIPWMLVVGEKEQAEKSVSARNYHTKEQNTLPLADFAASVALEVEERRLPIA